MLLLCFLLTEPLSSLVVSASALLCKTVAASGCAPAAAALTDATGISEGLVCALSASIQADFAGLHDGGESGLRISTHITMGVLLPCPAKDVPTLTLLAG